MTWTTVTEKTSSWSAVSEGSSSWSATSESTENWTKESPNIIPIFTPSAQFDSKKQLLDSQFFSLSDEFINSGGTILQTGENFDGMQIQYDRQVLHFGIVNLPTITANQVRLYGRFTAGAQNNQETTAFVTAKAPIVVAYNEAGEPIFGFGIRVKAKTLVNIIGAFWADHGLFDRIDLGGFSLSPYYDARVYDVDIALTYASSATASDGIIEGTSKEPDIVGGDTASESKTGIDIFDRGKPASIRVGFTDSYISFTPQTDLSNWGGSHHVGDVYFSTGSQTIRERLPAVVAEKESTWT